MKQIAGLSPVLYHQTRLINAVNILRTNRFELKNAVGNEFESKFGAGLYYMSTARSMTSAYIAGKSGVVFELDGVKLSHRHSGTAMDYFNPSRYKYTSGPGDARAELFEAEDRVFSDKPFIMARQYIKRAFCVVPESYLTEPNAAQWEFYKYCLRLHIPVMYFASTADMITKSKAKEIVFKPLRPARDPAKERQKLDSENYDLKFPERENEMLAMWYTLAVMPRKPDTPSVVQIYGMHKDKLKTAFNSLKYSYALTDFLDALQAPKFDGYGTVKKSREHLDKIISLMRSRKQTPAQFIQSLKDKWYPKGEGML